VIFTVFFPLRVSQPVIRPPLLRDIPGGRPVAVYVSVCPRNPGSPGWLHREVHWVTDGLLR